MPQVNTQIWPSVSQHAFEQLVCRCIPANAVRWHTTGTPSCPICSPPLPPGDMNACSAAPNALSVLTAVLAFLVDSRLFPSALRSAQLEISARDGLDHDSGREGIQNEWKSDGSVFHPHHHRCPRTYASSPARMPAILNQYAIQDELRQVIPTISSIRAMARAR